MVLVVVDWLGFGFEAGGFPVLISLILTFSVGLA